MSQPIFLLLTANEEDQFLAVQEEAKAVLNFNLPTLNLPNFGKPTFNMLKSIQ